MNLNFNKMINKNYKINIRKLILIKYKISINYKMILIKYNQRTNNIKSRLYYCNKT